MTRMLFVNTYVEDVAASRRFFGALGFEFDETFSDENTASMVINDATTVMLLARPKFQEFILDEMTDTSRSREMLLAVSADSREAVDTLADTALGHGGRAWTDPQDHGFMYGRSFRDLDGHVWEVIWMDPAVAAGDGPPDM